MDDYDDFGLDLVDDDLGAMDYPSLGQDYDDFGDEMEYPSLGAKNPRYRPRKRSHLQRPRSAAPRQQVVQKTILVGQSGNLIGAGQLIITIRPQFDFVAEDLTFQGSLTPATQPTIDSISFGDRIIFSNPIGVPIALFATGSFVRGLVKGAAIAAGLDIQITGNTAQALVSTTNLIASFTGLKRGTTGCGPGAV